MHTTRSAAHATGRSALAAASRAWVHAGAGQGNLLSVRRLLDPEAMRVVGDQKRGHDGCRVRQHKEHRRACKEQAGRPRGGEAGRGHGRPGERASPPCSTTPQTRHTDRRRTHAQHRRARRAPTPGASTHRTARALTRHAYAARDSRGPRPAGYADHERPDRSGA